MPYKDLELRRRTSKLYYQANNLRIRAYKRQYYATPKWRKYNREYAQRLKKLAFTAYGGAVCACCGEEHMEFLSIDHIGGGGRIHRQQPGVTANHFYQWLRQQGYPSGFRVLCMNCNFALGHFDYCPHGSLEPLQQIHLGGPSQKVSSTSPITLHPGGLLNSHGNQFSFIS